MFFNVGGKCYITLKIFIPHFDYICIKLVFSKIYFFTQQFGESTKDKKLIKYFIGKPVNDL
jgi:hypothetical protein